MLLTLHVSFILHSPSQKPIKLQLFDVSNWMLARKNQCIKINCPLLRFHIIYFRSFIYQPFIFIHLSSCTFIHPTHYPFICPCVHLFVCFFFIRQFICPSVCLFFSFVSSSVHLFFFFLFHSSVHLSICLSVFSFVSSSVHLFVCFFIRQFICPSVCLFFHPPVHPCICLSDFSSTSSSVHLFFWGVFSSISSSFHLFDCFFICWSIHPSIHLLTRWFQHYGPPLQQHTLWQGGCSPMRPTLSSQVICKASIYLISVFLFLAAIHMYLDGYELHSYWNTGYSAVTK